MVDTRRHAANELIAKPQFKWHYASTTRHLLNALGGALQVCASSRSRGLNPIVAGVDTVTSCSSMCDVNPIGHVGNERSCSIP